MNKTEHKKLKWAGASILLVAIILIGGAYLMKDETQNHIKIGVIGSMSGDLASLGANYANGIKLALEEYKREYPDASIELIIEDDGYDARKGISAYKKLASVDNVDAIINMTSPTIDAVSDQVNAWGKPFMQVFEESVHKDDNIFEVYPGQKVALVALGKQAKQDGHKRVSVVAENISAYQRFIDGFEEGFEGEVLLTRINPDQTDMRTFALKVLNEKPDAIAIFMGPSANAGFLKAMQQQSQSIPQLYFDTGVQLSLTELKAAMGGNVGILEGSKAATIISSTRSDFQIAYKERFGVDSGLPSDYGYDAFMMLMQNHDNSSNEWAKNIRRNSYEGASGSIKLDEFGDRIPQYEIKTFVNGDLR